MSVPNAGNYPTPFGGMFSRFYIGLVLQFLSWSLELLQRYSGPYIAVNSVDEGGPVVS